MAEELKERKAFEAHMRVGGYSNHDKHPDGSYVSSAMELWWQGWKARAQLPSQVGEAVEVVGYGCEGQIEVLKHVPLTGGMKVSGRQREKYSVPLMTVAQHQRILAASAHPADQVADDLTMVKVPRELLQDLRDLAFDQVEHHRAAMGAYKQTRQSAMDSVLAQADALLEVKS